MQSVCVFFQICKQFGFLISQGSVATCLRWGGYCHMDFVANFICFPAVQIFWKSVKTWQSYRQFNGGNFVETQCITACTVVQAVVKPNSQSNGNGQISTPWGSQTPERISMKLGIYNYVGVWPHMQIHMALRQRGWSRRTRDMSHVSVS